MLALDSLRAELLELSPLTLLPINIDIPAAVFTVIGAAPEVRRHRPAMVEWFGEEMAASVDRLETIARAAGQAHTEHLTIERGADIAPASAAAMEVRAGLLAEVQSLIARKLLGPGATAELRGTNGYRNQCFDILQLVSILRLSWATVGASSGLDLADLDRAEATANRLAIVVGLRDQGSDSPSADLRQRAYTLLIHTYDQLRRMLTFLRWAEGDVERVAPSFWRARRGRKRAAQSPESLVPLATSADEGVRVGMPGSSPFIEG